MMRWCALTGSASYKPGLTTPIGAGIGLNIGDRATMRQLSALKEFRVRMKG